jgi:isopentenyl-diphosphate delta-isomerase
MGFSCTLAPIGTFLYRADLDDGLIEHELVHLFRGIYDGPIAPNPDECDGFNWLTPDAIRAEIATAPETFTIWFQKYAEAGWPMSPPLEVV